MAFDISQFRARFPDGGARPNLFEVQIQDPSNSSVGENTRFFVRAAAMPSSVIGKTEAFYFGRSVPFAGDRTFEDWTATIINDEGFTVRQILEEWHNNINNRVRNLGNTSPDPGGGASSYLSSVDIKQYSKLESGGGAEVIRQYKLVNAFPLSISPIDLDWGQLNTIQEYDVTFAYDYFEIPVNNSLASDTGD